MKAHKNYIIAFCIYCACLFTGAEIYAHWHFDVINPGELYEMDRHSWELKNPGETAYMTYGEWHDMQDQRHRDFVEYVGNECAGVFDPWFEPAEHRDLEPQRE